MKHIFPLSLILLFFSACAPQGNHSRAQQDRTASESGDVIQDLRKTDSETIFIHYQNVSVSQTIRDVADIYDLNVVIPDNLNGRVYLKLQNVTWRQVFEIALESTGFTYIEASNIIRVREIEELVAEPVDTRVFIINFAEADQVKSILEPLANLSAGGHVQVDERSNILIITEKPSRMNRIQEIIERVDRETPQVKVEVKLYEISNTARRDSESDELFPITENLKGSEGAILNPNAFEAIKDHLNGISSARLISNHTVVVLDEEEATISIVERIPILTTISGNEDNAKESEYQEVKAAIRVRPDVNSAGFIHLSFSSEFITQEESSVVGTPISQQMLPAFASRSMSSKITVKDGYTLVVGGITEERNRSISIESLEKHTNRSFVIFLTARTLSPDGSDYRDVLDPRVMSRMGITKAEIPGYVIPEEQRNMLDKIEKLRIQATMLESKIELQSELQKLSVELEK